MKTIKEVQQELRALVGRADERDITLDEVVEVLEMLDKDLGQMHEALRPIAEWLPTADPAFDGLSIMEAIDIASKVTGIPIPE